MTYVTDAADTAANREQIVRLARGADHLFIEAAFLETDRALAESTAHLTARAAGEIARAAGARRVTGFHHSARFTGSRGRLTAELAAAMDVEAHGEEDQTPSVAQGEPNWVRRWRRSGVTIETALARFDGLPTVESSEIIGAWRGTEMPTVFLGVDRCTRFGPVLSTIDKVGAGTLVPARQSRERAKCRAQGHRTDQPGMAAGRASSGQVLMPARRPWRISTPTQTRRGRDVSTVFCAR